MRGMHGWIDAHRHKRRAGGVYTGEKENLGRVTGALRDERAGVEIMEQMSAWSQQTCSVCRAKRKSRL